MSEGDPIVAFLIGRIAELEAQHKKIIPWVSYLPKNQTLFTARQIADAMGKALDAAGIPNNLEKKDGDAE